MTRIQRYALGIGYKQVDYENASLVWREYGILLHIAGNEDEAVELLNSTEYVCVAICSDEISYSPLITRLRKVKSVPIIVLSPQYDAERREIFIQSGALQYFAQTKHLSDTVSGKNAVQQYLKLKEPEGTVTIIQRGELMLYDEYRKVEVRGKAIDLTPREFDILRLLIANPRRVFLYNEIFTRLWGEEYSGSSSRTITNLVSKLRIKLKAEACMSKYIKNFHNTGYRFDPD